MMPRPQRMTVQEQLRRHAELQTEIYQDTLGVAERISMENLRAAAARARPEEILRVTLDRETARFRLSGVSFDLEATEAEVRQRLAGCGLEPRDVQNQIDRIWTHGTLYVNTATREVFA